MGGVNRHSDPLLALPSACVYLRLCLFVYLFTCFVTTVFFMLFNDVSVVLFLIQLVPCCPHVVSLVRSGVYRGGL